MALTIDAVRQIIDTGAATLRTQRSAVDVGIDTTTYTSPAGVVIDSGTKTTPTARRFVRHAESNNRDS